MGNLVLYLRDPITEITRFQLSSFTPMCTVKISDDLPATDLNSDRAGGI